MVRQTAPATTQREKLLDEAIYSDKYQSASSAAHYDDVIYGPHSHDSAMWLVEQKVLRSMLVRHFPNHASARALDFACGPGRISRFVQPLVGELTGVDISEQMLARARAAGTNMQFIRADITASPDDVPGEMDIILAFRFLLLANPDLRLACVRALARKLRSQESIMVLNSHGNPYSYRAIASLRDRLLRRNRPPLPEFSLKDMREFAVQCGLELVDVRGMGLIPRSIARLMPERLFVAIESFLARIPVIWRLGTHLLFVLRRPATKDSPHQ